jgi:hypothetical protein
MSQRGDLETPVQNRRQKPASTKTSSAKAV